MKPQKQHLVDISIFDGYDNLVNNFLLSVDAPNSSETAEEVDDLMKAELLQYGETYWATATDWKYVGQDGKPIPNASCYVLSYGDWEEINVY